MYQKPCIYGAECGLLAQCECGCCITEHACECDDEFEDDEIDDYDSDLDDARYGDDYDEDYY